MKHRYQHRGFSMVEAVVAVGMVGSGVLVMMTAASGAVARRENAQARTVAAMLVGEVLEEIRSLPYEDPTVTTTTLGPESGETLASRSDADDADDLNGWVETGLQARSGGAAAGYSAWSRTIVVERVLTTDYVTTAAAETGVKRATVTVTRGGKVLSTGTTLIVKAWMDATP